MVNKIGLCFALIILLVACHPQNIEKKVVDLGGLHTVDTSEIWLSHEHILVDFIGADHINPTKWNQDSILQEMLPHLSKLSTYGVDYFVDATPNYLGRNVALFERIANETGLKILTNTGLYGARNNQHIPQFAKSSSATELADMWIKEFKFGIDNTEIKPGFIKIGVDAVDTLEPIDKKLVQAAATTHLETGLTIASHTGKAESMWPQLAILQQMGVAPNAFIWVHAQNEANHSHYIKAAEMGCWISLDGLGWETEKHIKKLLFAKKNGILENILISHDAGWFDPQKKEQTIQPYTNIFEQVIPRLSSMGFTNQEINQLMQYNPANAFAIAIRRDNSTLFNRLPFHQINQK